MKILILNGHDNYGNGGAENKVYGSEQKLTREFSLILSEELEKQGFEVTIFNPKMTDLSMYSYLSSHAGKFDFTKYDRILELHFNSGVVDILGDKRQTGTEILLHTKPVGGSCSLLATKILNKLASIGLRSRGVKYRSDLYVMNACYSQSVPHMLWEICFIGDKDDMEFYKEHTREIAEAFASEYISSCDTIGEWCYVDTDDKTALNIRSSKDTSSKSNIIGSIPNGVAIRVVKDGNDDRWVVTTYYGVTGFVVSRYLKKVMSGKVYTPSGGRLRVRRTPSISGHIVGHLDNGKKIYLYGIECDERGEKWRAVGVNIGQIDGYSSSEYIIEDK